MSDLGLSLVLFAVFAVGGVLGFGCGWAVGKSDEGDPHAD